MSINTSEPKPWTGRKFLMGLCAFFLTVFAANGVMVFYALSTFDGVETDDAYRKGRAYNHVLEADAAQTALGWTTVIETKASSGADGVSIYAHVTVTDTNSVPVSLRDPLLTYWRPTVQGMDAEIELAPAGDGSYQGGTRLQQPGNWIVRLTALTPEGAPYIFEERLVITPSAGATPG